MQERLFQTGIVLLVLGAMVAVAGLIGSCSPSWGGAGGLTLHACSQEVGLIALGVLILIFSILVFATGVWTSMKAVAPRLVARLAPSRGAQHPSNHTVAPRSTPAPLPAKPWTCRKCGTTNRTSSRTGVSAASLRCSHCGTARVRPPSAPPHGGPASKAPAPTSVRPGTHPRPSSSDRRPPARGRSPATTGK